MPSQRIHSTPYVLLLLAVRSLRLSDDGVLAGGGSRAAQVGLPGGPLGVLARKLLLGPLVAAGDQLLDKTTLLGLAGLVGVVVLLEVGDALVWCHGCELLVEAATVLYKGLAQPCNDVVCRLEQRPMVHSLALPTIAVLDGVASPAGRSSGVGVARARVEGGAVHCVLCA